MAGHNTKAPGAWDLERLCNRFPIVKRRLKNRGFQLSGGEQQLVAVARAMISNPSLILMDEPSEGLSPLIVEEIIKVIKELKEGGTSILIAEQNIYLALLAADYVYILSRGRIVYQGLCEEFKADNAVMEKYLTV